MTRRKKSRDQMQWEEECARAAKIPSTGPWCSICAERVVAQVGETCAPCLGTWSPGHNVRMAKKKRGYSRSFTPRSDRRLKFEADKVPPTIYARVTAKIRRINANGGRLSIRALIIELLDAWARNPPSQTPPGVE